ncbi:ankyrin [Xylaria sp. FL0933]|nr:ankyrin [Xylaria sp. FL0933]
MTTISDSDVIAACTVCNSESNWDTSAFKRLLDSGWDINSNYGHIGDALCIAVGANKAPLVWFLLDHSANPNANLRGDTHTPLELAAVVKADLEIIDLLLTHGAIFQGRSVMLLAAYNGRVDMLDMLVSAGANVDAILDNEDVYDNAREREDWGTPLHGAAGNNQAKAVEWLLSRGASTGIKNHVGLTPKQLADKRGHIECGNLL